MVRKRISYGYISFVLGDYNPHKDATIVALLNEMTIQEKLDIMSLRWEIIWWRMFLTFPERGDGANPESEQSWLNVYRRKTIWNFMRTEPPKSKQERYIVLKALFEDTFLRDGGERLRRLMNKSTISVDLLWEIPKGGLDAHETVLDCAMREFGEETDVDPSRYTVLPTIGPLVNSYTCNEVAYIDRYWPAIETSPIVPKISVAKSMQLIEIDAVQWKSINELRFLRHNGLLHIVATLFKLIKEARIPTPVKPIDDMKLYVDG
jgi:8-oxo-dGTP pyrophosphatase MutT (NUDIX family)